MLVMRVNVNANLFLNRFCTVGLNQKCHLMECGWKTGCAVILAVCVSGSKGAFLSRLFARAFFVEGVVAPRRVRDCGLLECNIVGGKFMMVSCLSILTFGSGQGTF